MQKWWLHSFRLVLALLTCAFLPCRAARIDLNWEAKQPGVSPLVQLATDFDVEFRDDVRDKITGGGTDAMTNAFPDPRMRTTLTALGNTRVRFFSGIPAPDGGNIPPDATKVHHFGMSASEELKAKEKTWTYDGVSLIVPEVQTSFLFNPSTNQLVVTGINLTDDTVTVTQAGYLFANARFPLQNLNRMVLPSSAFLSLTALNGEYLPGQSRSAIIAGANASDFIVTLGTFVFSGASSGNPYRLDASEWTQANVGETAIPEPTTVFLVACGLAALASARIRLAATLRVTRHRVVLKEIAADKV